MKLNKFANLLVIGLVLCCRSLRLQEEACQRDRTPGSAGREGPGYAVPANAIKPGEAPTGETDAGGVPAGGTPSNPANLHEGWIEDAQALKADTVYFDFDSSVLKAGEKPKVAAVADYLKANSGKAVRVEGNCDERGTEEYNRSLGERRALARARGTHPPGH